MAMEFDAGENQYMDCNVACNSLFGNNDPISLAIWFKIAAYPSDYPILIGARADPANDGAFLIFQNAATSIRFQLSVGGSGDSAEFDRTDAALDTWHLLTGTYQGSGVNLKIYLNDTLKDTNTSGNDWDTHSDNFYLGWNKDDDMYFDGLLADGRIYDRALSLEEIKTIHRTRGHDGIIDGLVGRWILNELPPGTEADGDGINKDSSKNLNHGTPNNAPIFQPGPLSVRSVNLGL